MDERVARNSEAHQRRRYVRRTPRELDRRCAASRPRPVARLSSEWSETMAYLVGLIASDGCLTRGRTITFTSEDLELVQLFLELLGRTNKIGQNGGAFRTQVGDVQLYDWLIQMGITERKSLTIGGIAIPAGFLFPLARGLLDGDGSLVNNVYAGTGKALGRSYEGFTTRFVSGSHDHLIWLQAQLERALSVRGWIAPRPPAGGCWTLNYAIRESCSLLPHLYPTAGVPKLDRKWEIWRAYAERHGHPATLEDLQRVQSEGLAGGRAGRDSAGRFASLSRAGLHPERS